MTSTDLIERWTRERDEIAFREIVMRHGPMVVATAKRILGNDIEAEDITQECFQTLATTRRSPGEHLGAWLHRVATNRCIDRIRTTNRRALREKAYSEQHRTTTEVTWNDIYELVDEAIATLPANQRAPIIAFFLEGRSQTEIASDLGLTRQAVTRRITRGIEGIRKHLTRRGVQVTATALTALFVEHTRATTISSALTASLGKIALSAQAVPAAGLLTLASLGGAAKWLSAVAAAALIATSVYVVRDHTRFASPPEQTPSLQNPIDAEPTGSAPFIAASQKIEPQSQAAEATTPPAPSSPRSPAVPEVIQGKLAPEPPNDNATVSGAVQFADGRPYANCRIYFDPIPRYKPPIQSKEPVLAITCDADDAGKFTMTNLKPGEYSVQVTPPKSNSSGPGFELALLKVDKRERRAGLKLVYGKEGKLTITGQITNALGEIFPDLTVNAYCESTRLRRSAVSDADGHFTISLLEPGQYRLSADHMIPAPPDSGYAYMSFDGNATAWAGDKDVKIIIPRPGTIEGRVINAKTGAPITNFKASARAGFMDGFNNNLTQYMTPFTASDGKFTLENVRPGEVAVTIMAEGFSTDYVQVKLIDGVPLKNVEIKLSPGQRINGRVVDDAGKPVSNVAIRFGELTEARARESTQEITRSDGSGHFVLTDLPKGIRSINAFLTGFSPASARPRDGMTIVLPKSSQLSVMVTDDGQPIVGTGVVIHVAASHYSEISETDRQGICHFTEVPPGAIQIRAGNRLHKAAELQKDILLNPGEAQSVIMDFAPATASLEGIVTWRGQPVPASTIVLWIETDGGRFEFRCPTSREGGYWFDRIPPGKAHIRIWSDQPPPRRPDAYRSLTLSEGVKSRLDIALVGACRIEGRFAGFDSSRQLVVLVVSGVHTLEEVDQGNVIGEGEFPSMIRYVQADARGSYSVDDLEPGDYTLIGETKPLDDFYDRNPFIAQQVHIDENQTIVVNFQKP